MTFKFSVDIYWRGNIYHKNFEFLHVIPVFINILFFFGVFFCFLLKSKPVRKKKIQLYYIENILQN